MSAKVNLGVTLGSLTLLVIIGVVVITGSKSNEENAIAANKNSEASKIIAEKVNTTLTDFVERWDARIKTSNKVNNSTQDKLLNISSELQERQKNLLSLANNQSKVLEYQLMNEHQIIAAEKNIIGNLTDHRIISNISNANQSDILESIKNVTGALTSKQYNEQAENKVASIIGNMTKEHQIIFKALNITANDNETDAETDISKLKKAIEALEQKNKLPPGLAKK